MVFIIQVIIGVWLSVLSMVAVAITAYDKSAARHRRRRIPEATLIYTAILGGSVAMLLTMLLIRHKTRHPKFMVGLPIILAVQLGLCWLIIRQLP